MLNDPINPHNPDPSYWQGHAIEQQMLKKLNNETLSAVSVVVADKDIIEAAIRVIRKNINLREDWILTDGPQGYGIYSTLQGMKSYSRSPSSYEIEAFKAIEFLKTNGVTGEVGVSGSTLAARPPLTSSTYQHPYLGPKVNSLNTIHPPIPVETLIRGLEKTEEVKHAAIDNKLAEDLAK